MPELVDSLLQALGGAAPEMSSAIGAAPAVTHVALLACVPAVLGAVAQTAQQPGGEQTLEQAAQQHAGLLGNLGGLLGATPADAPNPGGDLVERLFGERLEPVQRHMAQASGLTRDQARRLLTMVAPLALAVLAQYRNGGQLPAGGLARALRQSQGVAQQQLGNAPGAVVPERNERREETGEASPRLTKDAGRAAATS